MLPTAQAQDALALAEGSGDLQALRWAATTMAELDILEGRPEAARARLVPLLDRPGLEECDVTTLLPVLAWAQLELGQVDEAAENVEQALRRARPEEMRLVLVEALRVRALIALRRERWDEAARSLDGGPGAGAGHALPLRRGAAAAASTGCCTPSGGSRRPRGSGWRRRGPSSRGLAHGWTSSAWRRRSRVCLKTMRPTASADRAA